MSTTKLTSSQVKVYPTSSRDDTQDPKARFNTEKNLTSFVNRLTGIKSFIIEGIIDSSNILEEGGNKVLNISESLKDGTINIGGYIFYLESINLPTISSSDKVLYFEIHTIDSKDSLLGDENNTYKGLTLETGADIGTVTSSTKLVIARKSNDSWIIEDKAFTPFIASNINIQGETNTSQNIDSTLDDYLLKTMVLDDGVLF